MHQLITVAAAVSHRWISAEETMSCYHNIHPCSRFKSTLVSAPHICNLALFSLICIKQHWLTSHGSKSKIKMYKKQHDWEKHCCHDVFLCLCLRAHCLIICPGLYAIWSLRPQLLINNISYNHKWVVQNLAGAFVLKASKKKDTTYFYCYLSFFLNKAVYRMHVGEVVYLFVNMTTLCVYQNRVVSLCDSVWIWPDNIH